MEIDLSFSKVLFSFLIFIIFCLSGVDSLKLFELMTAITAFLNRLSDEGSRWILFVHGFFLLIHCLHIIPIEKNTSNF
jgi:hypothetical protein